MKLVISLFAFISSFSFAALPPYADSVRRVEAVIGSTDLAAKVSGDIVQIKSIEKLKFEVTTEICEATVNLEAILPKKGAVGATSYKVKSITDVNCE